MVLITVPSSLSSSLVPSFEIRLKKPGEGFCQPCSDSDGCVHGCKPVGKPQYDCVLVTNSNHFSRPLIRKCSPKERSVQAPHKTVTLGPFVVQCSMPPATGMAYTNACLACRRIFRPLSERMVRMPAPIASKCGNTSCFSTYGA